MKKTFLCKSLLILSTIGLVGCADSGDDSLGSDEQVSHSENESSADNETDSTNELNSDESSEWPVHYTTHINEDIINSHADIYTDIIEDYQNGQYTFEDPLVVQNPYDRAPLSALVMFDTEEPVEITVSVTGYTEDATITHTYEGMETEHELTVLGLYPDVENEVILTMETENGDINEKVLTMETSPVPDDMLDFTLKVAQPDKMQEGLTFVSPSRAYPAAVDHNGDVRWYTSVKSSNQFKRLENGNVLMATLEEGRDEHDHLTEMDMIGRVHQSILIDMESVIASAPLHHDTIILPNNNYLALLHDGSEEYVEDELAEIDRQTGEVIHRINFKDIFPSEMYEDYEGQGEDVGDWVHINAVWKLEDEDSLLLSPRNQDTMMKMSYPEGEIEWLFASPEDWPEELEDYLLEATDESLKFPTGAHAIMEMPDQDNNPNTLDVILFDNNRVITRGDEDVEEEFSRAAQYRVNEVDKTVEEVWSYGEDRGTGFYSSIVGDADHLPETDNVLLTSGRILTEDEERYSIMTEVTRTENPEVVYELHYGPFEADEYLQIYRSERMPLYP